MKNLNNDWRDSETMGSNGCQFKYISCKVNTIQCDKISSN